jgi:D-serine deaminase-like pyridoxal phosphate-dependent protein
MAGPSTRHAIGEPIEALDTPALLILADRLERNIARMSTFGREAGIGIRPHAKAHKTPVIAAMQLEAGAVGICCSKLGETEIMVEGGISDVLITGELAGAAKLRRLMALAGKARITVVIDNALAADRLSEAARAAGVEVSALIELDVGQGRCGVLPGAPAVALGEHVARLPGIALRGLQGYQGKLQHINGYEARAAAGREACCRLIATKALFAEKGLPVEIVTGAGTGTYDSEGRMAGLTDIQPGSYIFMDREYVEIGSVDGPLFDDFAPSLFVLATVISVPGDDRVVVDAGMKALSTDAGPAKVVDLPGWEYVAYGDEHGLLMRTGKAPQPKLGDLVRLMPGHCDTTVNLFDEFQVVRDGRLADVWPILARGRSQ